MLGFDAIFASEVDGGGGIDVHPSSVPFCVEFLKLLDVEMTESAVPFVPRSSSRNRKDGVRSGNGSNCKPVEVTFFHANTNSGRVLEKGDLVPFSVVGECA